MNKTLVYILPGAKALLSYLRFALTLVALMILACSIAQITVCHITWIKVISVVSIIVNLLYIITMKRLTSTSNYSKDKMDYYILYIMLLLSTMATLVMFLCGGDYSLYNILGIYILLESDKLILPMATIVFITVTYWLPITAIKNIHSKYHKFLSIKESINYG